MFCERCGEYSGRYALCKKCYHQTEESGYNMDWLFGDDEEYESTCIACQEGKDDDGYLFCRSCYYKYKNKTIILQIDKCTDVKLIDSYYYGRLKCKDGHIVKSKAEREIDNFLYDHNIRHCYEYTISIDGNEEHDLHPDFYLPDMNVYIEYWGKEDDEEYDKIKSYKMDIYRKLKITLICMYESIDAEDIEAALRRKLKNYKSGKINYL